jgi:2-desacetyl-2-hydroxyethyl bacteriochlorophyllide A dehydrogenase
MKALLLEQPGHFRYVNITDINKMVLADHEVLAKVHCIGICGTDYHAFKGNQPFFQYPRILGHELGVEVISIGKSVTLVKPGNHCAVEPYLNCGHCDACTRGKGNCCEHLQVMGVHIDGGMKEYCIVPEHKLHTSEKLSFEELALAETLSIGAHAVNRAEIMLKDTVLVVGAGPIGLSVMEFAQMRAAKVIAADVSIHRLDFCQEHQKADTVILLGQNPIHQIRNALNGILPSIVLDATGNSEAMMQTFDYAAHGGKIVFVGLFRGNISFDDPGFHRKELTLLATRNSLPGDFKNIINLLEEKKIDTGSWITNHVAFDDVIREFKRLSLPESRVIKAIINLP